jgi:hypothetical protein
MGIQANNLKLIVTHFRNVFCPFLKLNVEISVFIFLNLNRMHVMGQPPVSQHSPLQHQVSDAGSSHSAGSTRNVTPPLSIQQGRPLPALPVSPPPPQLPPRETGLQHAMLNRVGNGGTPTTSNSWMMPPPGRPAAPPPLVSSTNLDDDWENSSNDSNDLQRRRVQPGQHRGMGQQGDLNDLADAMAGFHPCKF